jgi:hypothetical protein
MVAGSLAMSIFPFWTKAFTLRLPAQPAGIPGTRLKPSRQRAFGLVLWLLCASGSFEPADFDEVCRTHDNVGKKPVLNHISTYFRAWMFGFNCQSYAISYFLPHFHTYEHPDIYKNSLFLRFSPCLKSVAFCPNLSATRIPGAWQYLPGSPNSLPQSGWLLRHYQQQ